MTIQTICRIYVSILILVALSSCANESLLDNGSAVVGGGGHTVTLRIIPTVVPISETKATVRAAKPGSEAAAAGFSYELVSSDHTDSTATEVFSAPVTKAPSKLKNVYALLFTSTGAFNGRASVGSISSNQVVDMEFTDVVSTTAAGCRLVIVANDVAAQNIYSSSGGTGGFSTFSGTYAQFQALTMTNAVKTDADIPYAGIVAVDMASSDISKVAKVPIFRTLASITLNNNFDVTGTPTVTRKKVELHYAGEKRFAPVGDTYDGSATTFTPTVNLIASPSAANATIGDEGFLFFVGENVRPAGGSDIIAQADRNTTKAPANSSYLRITSSTVAIGANAKPKIGEEYILAGTKYFTYDVYLGKSGDVKDFSLRRNTNYTITASITGSIEIQEVLAATDGRVTETFASGGGGGLVIGRFGGFEYTGGSGNIPINISGSHKKMLLLQPNISGTIAPDIISKRWSNSPKVYQADARRFWDKGYIYSTTTGGFIGGMDQATGDLHHYCQNLQIGGVTKGTWYVPTQAQLMAIWIVLRGLIDKNYSKYSAFDTAAEYWSCTEYDASNAYGMKPDIGITDKYVKTSRYAVRCVRDIENNQ